MFGLGGRGGTKATGRDAVYEALLGEFVRGMVEMGHASVGFDISEELLKVTFLTIHDPVLSGVTIGIDRHIGRNSGGPTRVSISAEARLRYADPEVLAKRHRTALDHISSAPAKSGVKLQGHWNSIIALVEMDIDPLDYTFKGEVGVSLIAKMLSGVLGDLKASIQPYI
jgi:hypothetical protein